MPPPNRSATCYGVASGTPLMEYETYEDAEEGASYVSNRYGNDMVPYECTLCYLWHLSPRKEEYPDDYDQCEYTNTTYSDPCGGAGYEHIPSGGHRKDSTSKTITYSTTCFGKRTKKPLLEFETVEEAIEGATYASSKYGNKMAAYHCSTCYCFHLCPATNSPAFTQPSKSSYCRGSDQNPLTEYRSEQEAKEGAMHAREQCGNNLVSYECKDCGWWHLSRRDRSTPCLPHCDALCRGKDGKLKEAYATEWDAETRAGIIRDERGTCLKPYECASTGLWHLTKKA